MSRSGDLTLLVPASAGWQVWKGSAKTGLSLERDTGVLIASDIDKVPATNVTMAFPARQATALPFKTAADDPELFADMAMLHLEQMGFRPEVGAGELFDHFELAPDEDGKHILMPVVLAPPAPGSTPLRTPRQFDISPRLFQMPESGIAVWQELGRWVFAIAKGGELIYFEGLSEVGLNDAAGREINLAIAQLQLQQCDPGATGVTVWVDGEMDHFDVPDEFVQALTMPVTSAPKPRPVLPERASILLPEDIVAARFARARARNIKLGLAAALLSIIALVGYGAWRLSELKQEVAKAEAIGENLEGAFGSLTEHYAKWDELEPIVDQENWPVQLVMDVASAVPREAKAGGAAFRLERVEVSNGFIIVEGAGEKIDHVNKFRDALARSTKLRDYEWSLPSPQSRNGQWAFVFEGTPPGQTVAQ